jgi:hypothetical protein
MGQPEDIARDARSGRDVIGWKLQRPERERLLERFAPRYPTIVADHVTLAAKVAADTPVPTDTFGEIVGHVDDGRGVEALVVAIDGATARPGGGTYHITWSLADGRRPKESNDVLAQGSWTRLPQSIAITLKGARF